MIPWKYRSKSLKIRVSPRFFLILLVTVTGSLLASKPASALDYTFKFGGIQGVVEGLEDFQEAQRPYFITITSGPDFALEEFGIVLGQYQYNDFSYPGPSGFSVNNGLVTLTGANGRFGSINYKRQDGPILRRIEFYSPGARPFFANWDPSGDGAAYIIQVGGSAFVPTPLDVSRGAVTFSGVSTQVPGAPGPLPLFGVGVAFGYGRKLRKFIKVSTFPVANARSATSENAP